MGKKELLGIWVLEAFRRGGVDTDRLVRKHPVEVQSLLTDPRTISPRELNTILNCCAHLSGDPSLGLHMIDHVDVIMLGPMGYLQMNAPTVRHLLKVTVDFYHTLYGSATFLFTSNHEVGRIEFQFDQPLGVCPRHQNEWSLGFLPDFISKQLGYRWTPLRAEFTNDAPDNIADLVKVFGGDISFNAPRTAFEFDVSILDVTLNKTNPHLLEVLTRQAEASMRDLGQPESFVAITRMQILEGLERGSANSTEIAHRLAMSRSTLKRRLADCDLTFRKLRDEIIHQVATEALSDTKIDVGVVAAKLGYSELSAFDRAFKRITGVNPTQFRDEYVANEKAEAAL